MTRPTTTTTNNNPNNPHSNPNSNPHSNQQQYKLCRIRLDKLGYLDPFMPDSTQLVMRLLNDLVQTTESCQRLKSELDRSLQDKRFIQNEAEPLRQEISHLTRENNQLHLDLIRASDARDQLNKKMQIAFKKYQNEIMDLKFLNKQQQQRIEMEQRKAEQERFRLEQIMGLLGNVVGKEIDTAVLNPAQLKASSKLLQHVQKIDIETGLEPMDSSSKSSSSKPNSFMPPDPHVGDLLKLTEVKTVELEKSNKQLVLQNQDLTSEVETMKEQIEVRDQEIARLGSLLEVERGHHTGFRKVHPSNGSGGAGGDGPSSMSESIRVSRVDQLELQIDFLNETIVELERSIKKLEHEKSSATLETNVHIEELTREVQVANERNAGLLRDLQTLEGMVRDLEVAKRGMGDGSSGGGSGSGGGGGGGGSKRPPPPPGGKKPPKAPQSKSNADTKKNQPDSTKNTPEYLELKEKYEHLLAEARELRRDLLNATRDLKSKTKLVEHIRSEHPDLKIDEQLVMKERNSNSAGDNDYGTTTMMEKLHSENEQLQSRLVQLEQDLHHSEIKIRELSHQADSFRNAESELLKSRTLISSLHQQITTVKLELDRMTKRCEELEVEKGELEKERRRVMGELDGVRRELGDCRVGRERLVSELGELRAHADNNAGASSSRPVKESTTTTAAAVKPNEGHELADLARMNEKLKDENQRLSKEIQKLQQLRSGRRTESPMAGRGRSSSPSFMDTSRTISPSPHRPSAFAATEIAPEQSLNSSELQNLRQAVGEREREIARLKDALQVIQLEKNDTAAERAHLSAQVDNLHETIHSLQEKLAQFNDKNHNETDILGEQRRIVEELDKERDQWQHELDVKTERIAELEQYIEGLKNHEDFNVHQAQALHDEVMVLQNHVKDQEKEVASLRRQLDDAQAQKQILDQERRRNVEDAETLRQELSAMGKERDAIQHEVAELMSTKEQLSHALTLYEERIHNFERLIQDKDAEYSQMMTTYRKLAQEHTELQSILQKGNSDENHLRMELRMRENQLVGLQQSHEEREAEFQQTKMELEAYANQCDSLTLSLESFEQELRKAQLERAQLVSEIETLRELLSQMQLSKDELEAKMMLCANETDRLSAVCGRAEREKDAILSELKQERDKSEKLEKLVAEQRTRQVRAEMAREQVLASKDNLEEHLHTIQEEQEHRNATLSKMTATISQFEDENSALRERIAYLERELDYQTEVLKQADQDRIRLKINLSSYEDLVKRTESLENVEFIRKASETDISNTGRPVTTVSAPVQESPQLKSPSEIDKRLYEELENTKKQLARYESLLAAKYPAAKKGKVTFSEAAMATSAEGTQRPAIVIASGSNTGGGAGVSTAATSTSTVRTTNQSSVFPGSTPTMTTTTTTVMDRQATIDSNSSPDIRDDHTNIVAKELLRSWNAQNVAMRRELESVSRNMMSSSSSSGMNITQQQPQPQQQQPQSSPMTAGIASSSAIIYDDELRHSLNESERHRREVEQENRELLKLVQEVVQDLKKREDEKE